MTRCQVDEEQPIPLSGDFLKVHLEPERHRPVPVDTAGVWQASREVRIGQRETGTRLLDAHCGRLRERVQDNGAARGRALRRACRRYEGVAPLIASSHVRHLRASAVAAAAEHEGGRAECHHERKDTSVADHTRAGRVLEEGHHTTGIARGGIGVAALVDISGVLPAYASTTVPARTTPLLLRDKAGNSRYRAFQTRKFKGVRV